MIFDWDNLFLAFMAGLAGNTTGKDIAYSNAIQILQARTLDGFVPNYAAGTFVSYDRTEPQIGAYVIRELFKRFNETWLVNATFDTLLGWNTWVWNKRRPSYGAFADLICLGSDPNTHPGGDDGTVNTMQAARYESGLDNWPGYDGPDKDSQGPGPAVCK